MEDVICLFPFPGTECFFSAGDVEKIIATVSPGFELHRLDMVFVRGGVRTPTFVVRRGVLAVSAASFSGDCLG